ncbi:MAG: tRNA-modifying protein YgfZ [Glaciecola sp.]|nr:tRNA-modifying protein YgfZ [Glaciecola sp.]MDG1815979.1 tRNA-modifying protein YgfZ [Glaciecola sp.]MDG2100340.1 tRNA-modifying protein YgfZ [Glaciecola sp.]
MSEFNAQWQAKLTHLGAIKVTGVDTQKYIQGQVTCNVESLLPEQWTFGAHCDFKGKMWNFFTAFYWHDAMYLLCDRDVIPSALAELKKYGVFSKVEITDASAELAIVGAADLSPINNQLFAQIASADKSVAAKQAHIRLTLGSNDRLRHIILSTDWSITDGLTEGSLVWQALDIQAGIGSISSATSNEYVPQMLNLQSLNAIDFKKGCYMGQEVVARTKYLGKNKRAGYILSAPAAFDVAVGELLEVQVGENWRRGGQVLSCGVLDGHTWLFAVLPNDTQAGTDLRVKSQPDIIVTTQVLPYSLDA